MEENTVKKEDSKIKNKFSLESKKLLGFVILFSFLFGTLGSFLGLNLYQEYYGKNSSPTLLGNKNIRVEQSSAIVDAVNKVSPAVVSITSEQSNLDFFGQVSKSKSSGTGFIITSDGLIITNKHVVSDQESNYSVFTSDGKEYNAEVKARDPLNDIAFLKISAKGLPIVELGDSDALKVGQTAVAIGNALGQYQNTVTSGVVSAIGRAIPVSDGSSTADTLENVIQTDAAINPGNSGGPLVNLDGQVIGINTAIDSSGQSIGFAIPINMAKAVIESVEKTGKVKRPYFGIKYVPITKEFATRNDISVSYGVLVYGGKGTLGVVPGSPADKAGIKENDIILEVNGEKIDNNKTLIGILQKHFPDDEVTLKVLRDKKEMTIKVKLGETK